MAARRGEVADQIEGGEWIHVRARDLGGGKVAKKIAIRPDQAAHERRLGLAAEMAAPVADFTDQPNH